jgi:DNA replication and repair protein RecF
LDFVSQNGAPDEIEINYQEAVSGDPQRARAVRIVRHNGSRLERIGDLMGLFHAVIFAPEDLMLVKEGPATRRRYLDLLISQVRPSYFSNLQQYTRQLMQRNKLLKDLRDTYGGSCQSGSLRQEDMLQLDVWDLALATQGAGLIEQRQQFTQRIASLAGQAQERISCGNEILFVKYRTVSGIKQNMNKEQIKDIYYRKLKSSFRDDFEKGTTNNGPHRDDLELSLDGEGLKPFASQGQQRSAVLALKLAELAVLRQDTGEAPVLLLDDVMSELDENRRASLLANIEDAQVFVTCTDARQVVSEIQREQQVSATESPKPLSFAFFRVRGGQVSASELGLNG